MSTKFLTTKQVAEMLGITPNALAIAYYRRRPHLPPRYAFGRQYRFIEEEVIAAIKRGVN